ncbi:MAG: hypothetical protein CMJ64_26730 [Planctomycetaceae bacterium]|nr:hypothetical protein [Planctomycetaceae bacterium]
MPQVFDSHDASLVTPAELRYGTARFPRSANAVQFVFHFDSPTVEMGRSQPDTGGLALNVS